MSGPTTGVVIRTYNEARMLPRVLDALERQVAKPLVTLVVDSGSTDDTVLIARRYAWVELLAIPKESFTFGYALNQGIRTLVERVDYLSFLSGHAVPVKPTWLSELVAPLAADERVVGVFGKQVPWPEHLANPIVRMLAETSYPECFGERFWASSERTFFSNANAVIRAGAWKKLPFNERLPGSEDWHWAAQMQQMGAMIAYQPAAAVYHSHPDTYGQYITRLAREYEGLLAVAPGELRDLSHGQFWREAMGLSLSLLKNSCFAPTGSGYQLRRFRLELATRRALLLAQTKAANARRKSLGLA